jgi:hypothetical protein
MPMTTTIARSEAKKDLKKDFIKYLLTVLLMHPCEEHKWLILEGINPRTAGRLFKYGPPSGVPGILKLLPEISPEINSLIPI